MNSNEWEWNIADGARAVSEIEAGDVEFVLEFCADSLNELFEHEEPPQ